MIRPMPQLILLRHAKTEAHNREGDHARVLTGRGLRDIALVSRELARRNLIPEQVLVSDATRTMQTAAALQKNLQDASQPAPKSVFEPGLYLAAPKSILHHIHTISDNVQTLAVIGHNPGLHELACALTGDGDPHLQRQLAGNFPTSAVAVLTFGEIQSRSSWADVAAGTGVLQHFFTAKQLRTDDAAANKRAPEAAMPRGKR